MAKYIHINKYSNIVLSFYNSQRRDTVHHTSMILRVWYFFPTYFVAGSRVALFNFSKFGPFGTDVCNSFVDFLKISVK